MGANDYSSAYNNESIVKQTAKTTKSDSRRNDSLALGKEAAHLENNKQTNIKIGGGKFYAFFKRTFDIISSFSAIILLSPLLLLIFVVETFVTKFHPIFADKRIGKGGKTINVYKFRSMYFDAEENIDKYLSKEQKEIRLRERKLDNDPRITPFGKFIRKTSLDELPQLFNILFGSMSVVGYRPMSEREVIDEFSLQDRIILLSAKPGLTGIWQVYGRDVIDFKSGERQRLEIGYFKKRSLMFDLKLIFLTIPSVLKKWGIDSGKSSIHLPFFL